MIAFHLSSRSGVPAYMQIVHQVKHALRFGILRPGDQLPTVRDVVAELGINPNTVSKAYRELEFEGLIGGRPGSGTFVLASLPGPEPDDGEAVLEELAAWLRRAMQAGLDEESVLALVADQLRMTARETAA